MDNSPISILVATFRRADELRLLLQSLERATQMVAEKCKVIVVDNDPAGAARSICLEEWQVEPEYLHQPIPGIAATRNAGIAAAAGSEFVVFVDDDEIVHNMWLHELLRVQRATGADMVAGPVHAVLPPTTTKRLHESGVFERETRTDQAVIGEAGTGNLLARYSLFSSRPNEQWFQEEFSFSGGSDAELTRRFHGDGASLVWAANAHIWEPVPPKRATWLWVSRRYRRIGAVDFRLSGQVRLKKTWGVATGFLRIVSGCTSFALRYLLTFKPDAASVKRLFRGVGFIEGATTGGRREYKRHKIVDEL